MLLIFLNTSACENTDSVRSNQRIRPTAPSVPLKQKVFLVLLSAVVRSATSCQMASKVILEFSELTSFWEAFYQHKRTCSKNDITSLERWSVNRACVGVLVEESEKRFCRA
ncbi:hypothetical protein Tco_1530145 [Tanacetum coccineum]